jgi:hypothetical protein
MMIDSSYANVSHQPMLKPMALAALWRHRAAKELRRWQQWLGDEGLLAAPVTASLALAQEQLTKLRYTIAVVAEVSRGKSELINAMLFAQYGRRIVPSGAGRTTMCPTEFFCDEDQAPFLELLPIDTRALNTPFAELYKDTAAWQRFDLSQLDSEVLAQALLKVSDTRMVSKPQAAQWGMDDDSFLPSTSGVDDTIEIPAWRYARVNLHHPLLATGLAILDTPGLNVLGHEPELTYAILPTVDAVLFLLSADSGVTRSDQQAWHQHLGHLPVHSKIAVINKIDTLRDDLRSALETQTDVLLQIERSALALELPKNQLFAISARGALTARIAQNDAQLTQSRLPLLESSLTTELLEKRQVLLKTHALEALEKSYRLCARELKGQILQVQTQLNELGTLNNSDNPEQALNAYASDTKKRYTLEAALSKSIDQTMGMHEARMLGILSASTMQQSFEAAIASCQNASASVIKQLLQAAVMQVHARVEHAAQESEQPLLSAQHAMTKVNKLNGIVDEMSGAALSQTLGTLSLESTLAELNRIAQTCGAQLSSLPLLSSSQRSKAAQTVMAVRLRCVQLGVEASTQCEQWLDGLTEPIHHALKLHQTLLHKRTDTLERMQQAQQALIHNLTSLRETLISLEQQLARMKQRCEQASWAIAGNADSNLSSPL